MTNSVLARAEALDALDSVLPFDRREFLAGLLSDEDVATLAPFGQARHWRKHFARPCLRPWLPRGLVSGSDGITAGLAGA